MKIKISELLSRVYALLNENETILEEKVEYGDPGTMLRPLIIDLLPDAARVVLERASPKQIDSCARLEGLTAQRENGLPTARLPEDFLRLVHLKMDCWPYGISTPVAYGSEEYHLKLRHSLRGDGRHSSPGAAICRRGDIRAIELFGCGAESASGTLEYLRIPEIDGQYIDIPPALTGEVCKTTAAMVSDVIDR